MIDFGNSVIIPRDDFVELETAAYSQPPRTIKDRSLDTLQASVLIVVVGATFAGGCWAWQKATVWYDEKVFQRRMRQPDPEKYTYK